MAGFNLSLSQLERNLFVHLYWNSLCCLEIIHCSVKKLRIERHRTAQAPSERFFVWFRQDLWEKLTVRFVAGLEAAISALGTKTSLGELVHVGWKPVAMVVIETLVVLTWVSAMLLLHPFG